MNEIKMHKVRMYWRTKDEVAEWNERMAWVTDNFGLPGGRWISHAKEDWIDIFFDDDADAVIFKLKFGQYCKD